jgi:hypothetical protein
MFFSFLHLAVSVLLRLPVVRFANWPLTLSQARLMVAASPNRSEPMPRGRRRVSRRERNAARPGTDGQGGRRMKAPPTRCPLLSENFLTGREDCSRRRG